MLRGQIGNYSIIRRLGSGGMGVVYEAHDDRLDRKVAIKVLPEDVAADPERRRRAQREARMAASLDHPFICKVYEVVDLGDQTAIVMEYVEGSTLKHLLTAGPLAPGRIVRMAHELAEALDVAHASGLVHRDIKPSNIMITVHDHPKVMDFGIAKEIRDAGTDDTTTITEPGAVLGTPFYMSPEQASGEIVDQRSDIFSFGIVLYECLTGELPFEGSSRGAYLTNLVAVRRKPFPDSVPGSLRDPIDQCLAPDPGQRFATFSEVTATLDEISTQLQPVAQQTRTARSRASVRGITLVAAAIIAVLLGMYPWPADEPSGGLDTIVSQEAVVTWPTRENGGSVSPSGRIVAFLSNREDGRRVWLRSMQGNEPRPITSPRRLIKNVVWSPDEERVAYLFGEDGEVYLQVASIWGEPVLSPVHVEYAFDNIRLLRWLGDRIYLLAEPAGTAGAELWHFDLAGAQERTLTRIASDLRIASSGNRPAADISSDGATLVYVGISDGSNDLWVADADGGNPRRLTNSPYRVLAPRWRGPDDSSIVYISNENGQFDIWEYDLSRGVSRPLTSSPLEEETVSVSADGRTFIVDTRQEGSNLWAVDLQDRSPPVQLTNDSRSDLWPSGTEHSNRFVFHRTRGGPSRGGFAPFESTLFFADLKTIRSGPISTTITNAFGGRLSPGGDWVVFLRYVADPEPRAEVWLYDSRTRADAQQISDIYALPDLVVESMSWSSSNMVWAGANDLYYVTVGAERKYEITLARIGSRSQIQRETAVRASDPGIRLGDLRLSRDAGRLGFVATAGEASPGCQLRVLDIASGQTETLASFAKGREVVFLGWRSDDSAVVLSMPRASRAGPVTELNLVSPNGAITTIATLVATDGIGAAYDVRRDTVYLTHVEGRLRGVRAYSLTDRQLVPIVDASVPGIFFGGFELVGERTLLFIRKEDKSDIWSLKFQ